MKVTGDTIEIFFDDLNEGVKKEFLKTMGMKTSEEGNYDIVPIAIVPIPEINGYSSGL